MLLGPAGWVLVRALRLPFPTVEASADRLKCAGWSAADVAVPGPAGVGWFVIASRGGRRVKGWGASQAEAWHRTCLQAEALGSPGVDPSPFSSPPVPS
jgi:hypothetical protein